MKNLISQPKKKLTWEEKFDQLFKPYIESECKKCEERQDCYKTLCLYDGIKLRSYDAAYIEWLKSQEKLFKFQVTTNPLTKQILRYKGKYKNFDINISYLPNREWAVDFSGSVHKWFNQGKHNYNDFYWGDFLKVYKDLMEVFKFDQYKLEVVNLEVGVNCKLPEWMKVTTSEIIENILALHGKCNAKSRNQKSKRDSLRVDKGNRYQKIYCKTSQYKLKDQVIRVEQGYDRARPLIKDVGLAEGGKVFFYDLSKLSLLFHFKKVLEFAFDNLHLAQPDIKNVPVSEIEANKNILEYSRPAFWCSLKKKNISEYNRERRNQDRLTEKYCTYHLSKDFKRMLQQKLQ